MPKSTQICQFRSSSLNQTCFAAPVLPPCPPSSFKYNKYAPSLKQNPLQKRRDVIFTLSPPPRECYQRNLVDESYGEFLKVCHNCKKKLKETEDVYMVGYLQAFCSFKCSKVQMKIDSFKERNSSPETRRATAKAEHFLREGLRDQAKYRRERQIALDAN